VKHLKRRSAVKWLAFVLPSLMIIYLLVPSRLTDSQLAQIKVGMTIHEVEQLLGEPCNKGIISSSSSNKRTSYASGWFMMGEFWQPSLAVTFPPETIIAFSDKHIPESSIWFGKEQLLWVEHDNGVVVKTWQFPLRRSGGGLQGCFNSIKKYWNQWLSK
jgi:hypothetical protein